MDELLAPVSTLDEPVMETIMRDVRAVGAKLRAVLIPLDRHVSVEYVFGSRGGVDDIPSYWCLKGLPPVQARARYLIYFIFLIYLKSLPII